MTERSIRTANPSQPDRCNEAQRPVSGSYAAAPESSAEDHYVITAAISGKEESRDLAEYRRAWLLLGQGNHGLSFLVSGSAAVKQSRQHGRLGHLTKDRADLALARRREASPA